MNNFVFLLAAFIFCQTSRAQIFTTTTTATTTTPSTTTTTVTQSPGILFTLAPGVTINTTLISQRPDENAFNSLISYLPEGQQTDLRNIRGNIFMTLSQQNEQILSYLSEQSGNSSVSLL